MKKSNKIYLDYASSSLRGSPNPSAIHELGLQEKRKLARARERVAEVLGARPDEIIFTSGATESNNLAVLGMPKGHIVTTNIEHASVLETARHRGDVTFVPVETNGIVDPKKILKAIRSDTVLVSVMYANNEIGTIQPLGEIAKVIRHANKTRKKKTYFHTDAVQAANFLELNVAKLGVDLLSLNGAKIYGPKSTGVLYVRTGTPLSPIMWGGEQEGGLRPGTENPDLVLELALALEQAQKIKEKESDRLSELRDYFFDSLARLSKKILINGDRLNRLPNNVNITIPNIPSDLLVIELSARGIMASAKSACKAGDGKDSYVIAALRNTDGLPAKAGAEAGSIRFSLGRETKKEDIDYAVQELSKILRKLEKWYT